MVTRPLVRKRSRRERAAGRVIQRRLCSQAMGVRLPGAVREVFSVWCLVSEGRDGSLPEGGEPAEKGHKDHERDGQHHEGDGGDGAHGDGRRWGSVLLEVGVESGQQMHAGCVSLCRSTCPASMSLAFAVCAATP